MDRHELQPGEKIRVSMTAHDRELLREQTNADPEYAQRLRPTADGEAFVGEYSLDDLEDVLGYIASHANHTEDRKLQRELYALYDRLFQIQRSYDDGNWNDSAI